MKKGLIIVNPFAKSEGQRWQVVRLKEEFAKLGITLDTAPNYATSYIHNCSAVSNVSDCDFALYLDKDKYYAQLLESANVRLFNSALAIELSDDKMLTYITLLKANVNMPDAVSSPLNYSAQDEKKVFLDEVIAKLDFPIVVKNSHGSLGAQVYLAHNKGELETLYDKLLRLPHLYQRYIASSKGRDCRVITVGGEVVAAMHRVNTSDFRSNLEVGGVGVQCTLTQEQVNLARTVSNTLGLDYCGIDILFGADGEAIFCEANSNAYFRGIERVSGINVAERYAAHVYNKVYGGK